MKYTPVADMVVDFNQHLSDKDNQNDVSHLNSNHDIKCQLSSNSKSPFS